MLPVILVSSLLTPRQSPALDFVHYLDSGGGVEEFAYVKIMGAPLDPPKLAPRAQEPGGEKWEYPWLTTGFVKSDQGQYNLRFRVFSQQRKDQGDPAIKVARMSLRLWELLITKLSADHQPTQKDRNFVDIYLAWGGEAGGEQAIVEDVEYDAGTDTRYRVRSNTITIYDIASFTEPLEMAREVAHEYGHATLPAVGGFETPEDWGNGYLGEKLYLRWLRDLMLDMRIDKDDVMGARVADLDAWVMRNVTPLVQKAAAAPPDKKLLAGKGQKSLDAYLGLALYADSILPDRVFGRSLRLIGSNRAEDYPKALVLAVAERDFELEVPSILAGKPLWIPLGNARIENAKVLQKSGNWVQVQPSAKPVRILAPKQVTGG